MHGSSGVAISSALSRQRWDLITSLVPAGVLSQFPQSYLSDMQRAVRILDNETYAALVVELTSVSESEWSILESRLRTALPLAEGTVAAWQTALGTSSRSDVFAVWATHFVEDLDFRSAVLD